MVGFHRRTSLYRCANLPHRHRRPMRGPFIGRPRAYVQRNLQARKRFPCLDAGRGCQGQHGRLQGADGCEDDGKEMQKEPPTSRSAAAFARVAIRNPKTLHVDFQRPRDPTRSQRCGGALLPSGGTRQTRRGTFVGRLAGWALAIAGTILLMGCGSSLVGPAGSAAVPSGAPLTVPTTAQCSGDGLAAQDLAGQCRAVPTTMGALEATG